MEWIPEVKYWKDRQITDLKDIIKKRVKGFFECSNFILIWFDDFQWILIGAFQQYDELSEPYMENDFTIEILWILVESGLVNEDIYYKQKKENEKIYKNKIKERELLELKRLKDKYEQD